jgi:outer membrane receptor protein involved in Fe transport
LDDHTIVIAGAGSSTSNSVELKLSSAKGSARAEIDDQIMTPRAEVAADSMTKQSQSSSQTVGLEEIVVTGTHIHNAEPISPVVTLTHDEMINQGYTTLDQVIEQLPQNFKAGASQESNPVNGKGNGASNNYGYASGVNLRGLGANATLVLLNGRRLAPTAFGGVTDISQIPVSIIDHVEIMSDGASALYGSDAVAGVVNVITKHDYSGIELGARVNGISDGKTPNYAGSLLGGFSWNAGNVVVDFDHELDNPLFARNRSFTSTLPDPTMLLPRNETSSYYVSLQNKFSGRLNLSGDALVTRRKYATQDRLAATDPLPYNASGTVDQYSGSLQLDYSISSEWTATLVGQGSKEADDSKLVYPNFDTIYRYHPLDYKVFSIEPRIDGKLFDEPGGAVRLALGGQLRRETFKNKYASGPATGPLTLLTMTDESRHIASAYGELLVPIIGEDNSTRFAKRLRINVSGRYDDYTDFGHTSNPKIGAEWIPLTGLALHATYSRSFQAPTLYETSNAINEGIVMTVPDPRSPSGSSVALLVDGTNPSLQPETAKSFNAGLTYKPQFVEGLKLDASYFSIDFDNQINRLSNVFFTNFLQEEAVLGSFIERDPSLAQTNQALSQVGRTIYNGEAGYCAVGTLGCPSVNPGGVAAIANLGYQNSASVRVHGVDLTTRYIGPQTAFGRFRADLDGTFITTYRQRITPAATEASPLNTVYNPLRFRAKANIGWEQGGLGVNARLNYSNAYENSDAVNPSCPNAAGCQIGSWTTVDWSLSYVTTGRGAGTPFAGVRIGLDVTNIFNRAPPLVSSVPGSDLYPYDPANANAFLRVIAISVTKRWGGDGGR